MNTRNPKIDGGATTVQSLLQTMKKDNPQEFRVVGTRQVPDWRGVNNHFQGIAPVNGEASITGDISASADRAWFATFREGSGSPSVVEGVWTTQYYDHAGGVQRIGEILALPLENDNGGSTVAFFQGTRYLYELDLPDGHKASAAAVTSFTDSAGVEQALLLVYRYDPKSFNIYRAPADSIGTNTWVRVGETSEISGREQYQCFGLVTQTSTAGADDVYLVGFREDEKVVLFSLVTLGSFFGMLAELQRFQFDGSQWRYGVGLQIVSSTMIPHLRLQRGPERLPRRLPLPHLLLGLRPSSYQVQRPDASQNPWVPVQRGVVAVQRSSALLQRDDAQLHRNVAQVQRSIVSLHWRSAQLQRGDALLQWKVAQVQPGFAPLHWCSAPHQRSVVPVLRNDAELQPGAAPLQWRSVPVPRSFVRLRTRTARV